MTTTMKMVLGSFAACFALGAVAEDPTVSGVMVRQRWPWSRLVDIDYVLTCDPGVEVDIAVEAYDGATPLALPLNSFSGDLYGVGRGLRRIVWDPTVTAYTNSGALPQFRVALTPTPLPLYMIVDLTKAAGATNQIEYVYEDALTNGLWGTWVRNPVTNNATVIESVVWTGVATNNIYKTDKLVLRRISAGSFRMGDTQNGTPNVTLTKGMFAGVFEVTQKQWNHIMGTTGGTETQAKQYVSYHQIRENPEGEKGMDDPDVDWPSNKTVNAGSFMGKLRAKTGIAEFDLPTQAQWEYLCRARTTTVFNDGNTDAKYNTKGDVEEYNNGDTNKYLNALGCYIYNDPTPPTEPLPVGGKLPNAWGLYDTHGNVWEWCLDWYAELLEGGEDPKGAKSGSLRVRRGGCWGDPASRCRSAYFYGSDPTSCNGNIGFRLVRTLP